MAQPAENRVQRPPDVGVTMSEKISEKQLADLLAHYAVALEADLERWLVGPAAPAALAEAMRYCMLGGGKRIRPALVSMANAAVGGSSDDEMVARTGVAVELVHSYSLVHDDLPAMDNDVLRRGMPTAHVKFGEAMAILTGDALLTRAFGVLSETHDPRSAWLVAELAAGAGPAGMVAGQVADMDLCDIPAELAGTEYIHERKTAALIRSAVRMGAICGRADDEQMEAVSTYGLNLGMAYQAVDDLLDVVGTAETTGKTCGQDTRSEKRTIVAQLGLDGAKRLGRDLSDRAVAALASLGPADDELKLLAQLLAERTY